MPTNYPYILFDLDGTLSDPKKGIVKSFRYALEKLGIKETDEKRIASYIGPPVFESLKKNYQLDDQTAWKGVEYYREYFGKEGLYENILFPGIHDLVRALYNDGRVLYVATAKPTAFAIDIVKFFNLQEYFEDVLGPAYEDKYQDKSKVIQQILQKHPGKDKKLFVMIGDRASDMEAAKKCNIDSIGVLFGYGLKEEIENAKPTKIVHSIKDLEVLLLPKK